MRTLPMVHAALGFIRCRCRGRRFHGLVLLSFMVLSVLLSLTRVKLSVNDDESDKGHPLRHFVSNSSVDQYVSLCEARMNGDHRLGNHLFFLAAMLYVVKQTNRRILMKSEGWCLDNVFQLNGVLRFRDKQLSVPGSRRVMRPKSLLWQSFDDNLSVRNGTSSVQTYTERTLELCGLYQTTVYADAVEANLRKMLHFKQDVESIAAQFIDAVCPKSKSLWNFIRCIGVHVRRGDFLKKGEARRGLTTITETYLRDAMQYFIDRYKGVHFVITSDDQPWVRASLRLMFPRSVAMNAGNTFLLEDDVHITLSVNQSAAVDFAILTMCDGLVISTGSFSWWAAWLAKKTTVYYANWPRDNSALANVTDPETYFPHDWIPMN